MSFKIFLKVDKNALNDLIKFWKKSLKNKNIQIVVSSSMLFKESYSSDLERISNEIIKLEYLNFIAIKEFFPNMDRLDQLYVYSY